MRLPRAPTRSGSSRASRASQPMGHSRWLLAVRRDVLVIASRKERPEGQERRDGQESEERQASNPPVTLPFLVPSPSRPSCPSATTVQGRWSAYTYTLTALRSLEGDSGCKDGRVPDEATRTRARAIGSRRLHWVRRLVKAGVGRYPGRGSARRSAVSGSHISSVVCEDRGACGFNTCTPIELSCRKQLRCTKKSPAFRDETQSG
jgi:hypothetical protein